MVVWCLVEVSCLGVGAVLGLVEGADCGWEGLLRGVWLCVLARLVGTAAECMSSSSPTSSSESSSSVLPSSSSSSASASGFSVVGSWGLKGDGWISFLESGLAGARIFGRSLSSSHLFSSSSKQPGSPMLARCA